MGQLIRNGAIIQISAKQRLADRQQWSSKKLLYRFTPVLSLSRARVTLIAAGHHHTLMIDDSGQVLSFGEGSHGQLGHGSRDCLIKPQAIKLLHPGNLGTNNNHVVALAAGMTFSMALTAKGEIYTWGSGPYGELGLGSKHKFAPEPERIQTFPPAVGNEGFTLIECGAHHAMALSAKDRKMLCVWGRNDFGQLGNGTRLNTFEPETLNRAETWWRSCVAMMSGGDRHSAIVTEAGDLWCWGRGRHGQLCQATKVRNQDTLDILVPRVLDHLQNKVVVQVTCGARHTCILTTEGTLYLYGGLAYEENKQGIAIDFSAVGADAIAEIRSGGPHLFVRDVNGRAYSILCETHSNILQRKAPLFSDSKLLPISAEGDIEGPPLCPMHLKEPAEEVAYLDGIIDDMLVEIDENGITACNEAHKAWDASQLLSTTLLEKLYDGVQQPVDTLLYAGQSPFFRPGDLPERAQSPGTVARRAREFSEAFQSQYKKAVPPVIVRRKTQYLGRDIGYRGQGSFERYRRVLAEQAANWGDLLEEQGWSLEVEAGNYIPYNTLYDIQAYGRRLEDDNSILEMRRIFFYFDKDGSGSIDVYEMAIAMQQLGYNIGLRKAKRIMKKYDDNKDGTMSLEEFLDFCYAEIVRKGRNGGFFQRLFLRRPVVGRTDPPPAIPPKDPPAKLRREEKEYRLWFKYRRRLRAVPRVFPDTYSRFVKAFMRECVELSIWGDIPPRLRHQLCVPGAQPLFHIGEIDLMDCDMTDPYVEALCTALKCAPMIRRIDLRHNHITKVGADLIKTVMVFHDELADYQECAKCLTCGQILDFDNPSNPRTKSESCPCSPGSRGGRLYQLPVYFLEHVVIEDPMTKQQRMASHKISLALELDNFTARALRKGLTMRTFLKGHVVDVREDDPVADAHSQPTKTFGEDNFREWFNLRIERAQRDFERALTQHVDHSTKIREIRRVFLEADADNSGYLDLKELRVCLVRLGIDRKLAKSMFAEIDNDGNGFVTLDELEQHIVNLAQDSNMKMLNRKRKNAATEDEVKREQEEINALVQELGTFGELLWERFHLLQYRAHANGQLYKVTIKLKHKLFNLCRESFHSAGPPVKESFILSFTQNHKEDCWLDLRKTFPWTAENTMWNECDANVLGFTNMLKAHYLALNRQVRIVQLSPGLRHALFLTERQLPWVRGFQDDGKQEAQTLWNERIVQGIQNLEVVGTD